MFCADISLGKRCSILLSYRAARAVRALVNSAGWQTPPDVAWIWRRGGRGRQRRVPSTPCKLTRLRRLIQGLPGWNVGLVIVQARLGVASLLRLQH